MRFANTGPGSVDIKDACNFKLNLSLTTVVVLKNTDQKKTNLLLGSLSKKKYSMCNVGSQVIMILFIYMNLDAIIRNPFV